MKRALPIRIAALASAVMLISASAANAQINFAGGTQFRFNGAGSFGNSATLAGLTLTGTGGTTTGGSNSFSVNLAGSGSTAHIGPGGTGNLGTGTLVDFGTVCVNSPNNNSTCGYNYSGSLVEMLVNFSSPTTPFQTFSGILSGRVKSNSSGGIDIDWGNSVTGNWTTATANGTYSLVLTDPFSVNKSAASDIGGDLTINTYNTNVAVTATPEPASLMLIGTGLVGVFAVGARRRKKA